MDFIVCPIPSEGTIEKLFYITGQVNNWDCDWLTAQINYRYKICFINNTSRCGSNDAGGR